MASPIVRGQNFGTTEIVDATKLQNIVDNSTFKGTDGNGVSFSASSGGDLGACVATGGLEVHSTGQLQIKDNGVTLAKMATQADQTVLGNVSGGTAVPTAVPIVGASGVLKNDDALGTSDTQGATQGNVKAYVDSHGITQSTGTAPYFGVRAWANYNGTTDTLNASGNIASVVRNSTGHYTFTFTTAMPDTNYAVSLSYSNEVNQQHGVGFINKPLTTTHFQVAHYDASSSSRSMDKEFVFVSVIR